MAKMIEFVMSMRLINNKSHSHAMEMSVSLWRLCKKGFYPWHQGDIKDCIPLVYTACGDCKEEREEILFVMPLC